MLASPDWARRPGLDTVCAHHVGVGDARGGAMTRDEAVAALSIEAEAHPLVRIAVARLRDDGEDPTKVLVDLALGLAMTKSAMNVKLGRVLGLDAEKWLGDER
ncbi:MAG: hypothetical protein COA38_20525 [Fluviicola sp.]|nr:MAG: hypothetical protein COA38_20525 [Fluviicola sp.]